MRIGVTSASSGARLAFGFLPVPLSLALEFSCNITASIAPKLPQPAPERRGGRQERPERPAWSGQAHKVGYV